MPRHGADGLGMALAPGDALVEATGVAVRVAAAHQTDRVRGFDECPFEVAVDVGAEAPVAQLVPARVDAAGAAGVAGELLGGGKPGDVADLERDHDGLREPHPRHRGQKLNGQRRLKHTLDPVLEAGHLAVQTLDLLEQFPGGIGGVGWQQLAALSQQLAPATAEEIRHLQVVEAVLGQGGVEPILELGALTDERHPRPRQLALVPQLAGRNPHRGQQDHFIAPERDNIDRLKRALHSVFDDPHIDEISADDLLGEYPAVQYVPPDGTFHVDILVKLGEAFQFDDLEPLRIPFEDLTVSVASPATLYRMKRNTVRLKDRADAELLKERFTLDEDD